jgi:hypothetical protein
VNADQENPRAADYLVREIVLAESNVMKRADLSGALLVIVAALLLVDAAPATAQIAVSARSLDFGSVTNASTPVRKTWTLTNNGRTTFQLPPYPTYQFKAVSTPYTESGTFYVDGGNCTPGLVLKSKETCSFTIAFQPRGFGDKSVVFTLNRPDFNLPVTLTGKRLEPTDYSTAGYGGSRTNPAKSVEDLQTRRTSSSNGYYWFDPDGAGGRPPFLAYVELIVQSSTANKDGWMLVRRIPKGTTWFPLNDNLSGAGFNTDENGFVDSLAGTPLTPTGSKPASLQFDYLLRADTEFMFAATTKSDGTPRLWCVIARGADGRFGGSLNSSLQTTTVVAYAGTKETTALPSTPPTKPSVTNVIFGTLYGAPFIGCEGTFSLNQSWMLYGEDGATSYNGLLNSSYYNGINVYIRKIKTSN